MTVATALAVSWKPLPTAKPARSSIVQCLDVGIVTPAAWPGLPRRRRDASGMDYPACPPPVARR